MFLAEIKLMADDILDTRSNHFHQEIFDDFAEGIKHIDWLVIVRIRLGFVKFRNYNYSGHFPMSGEVGKL